jgi:hypothetical protein
LSCYIPNKAAQRECCRFDAFSVLPVAASRADRR